MPEGNQNVTRELQTLFKEQLSLYTTMALATSDSRGVVDCATVYFAVDESGILYFSTDTIGVRKVVNLKENVRVAAVMDDGGQTTKGIQIRGKAEELLNSSQVTRARELLESRIPAIREFLKKPSVRFYRLIPGERFLINFSWGVDWRRQVPF